MAKKRRHRTWWFPVFSSEKHIIEKNHVIGSVENKDFPILFDDRTVAYGYAVGRRLDVKRDDNDEVITNEKGYAQLKNLGKITLIGIKGDQIDWKKADVLDKPDKMKGEAIATSYNIPVNKQTLQTVVEESDEMFNRYAKSPLAKAGGIQPILSHEEEGLLLDEQAEQLEKEIEEFEEEMRMENGDDASATEALPSEA